MKLRACLALLAFAACTKSTPPRTTVADGSAHVAVAVDAGATTAVSPDATQKGTNMTPEAIIAAHFESIGWGAPKNLVAYPHVPGFYRAEWPDGLDYALIEKGALVPKGGGLDAMAKYMKDVQLLSQQILEVDDVVTLVLYFDAWATDALKDNYYKGQDTKALQPKFELGVGEGRLTLSYPKPGGGGAMPNPNIIKVARATLTLAKDYKLTWKSELIDFDTK